MTVSRESRICRDWDFDDAESFHLNQCGKKTVSAIKEFHVRDAVAFEHAIRAAGIADFFAGEFVAHPNGVARGGNSNLHVAFSSRCSARTANAVRISKRSEHRRHIFGMAYESRVQRGDG